MNIEKCVILIDENLPTGVIANTAGIIGVSFGKHIGEYVGSDVYDKSGNCHLGIITVPIPILKADKEKLKAIRKKLFQEKYSNLLVVDFSDVAQKCNTYELFIENAAKVYEEDYNYYGIGICGDKKTINKLTGSLPLLK